MLQSYTGDGRLLVETPIRIKCNEIKIKAGELWHSLFTVNEITKSDKFVSENQKSQQKQNQPIRAKLAC